MTEKELKEVLGKLDTIALAVTGLAESVKYLASVVALKDERVDGIETRMEALENSINTEE